jgi:hypothetical protein
LESTNLKTSVDTAPSDETADLSSTIETSCLFV